MAPNRDGEGPSDLLSPATKKVLRGYAAGGLGAICATTITNPIEVVKTRLQLQGELKLAHERPYKGIFHCFKTIYQQEGVRGMQKGLIPACFAQMVLNGGRLGTYPFLKSILNVSPESKLFVFQNILAGAASGAIAASLASPLDLVKVRMQAQSPTAYLGHDFKYKNSFDAIRQIYRAEGLKGFIRGSLTSAQRTAVGSSVQLPTYDHTKMHLIKSGLFEDNIWAHFASSLVAGLVATTAMNPVDVARTRIYNQKVSADGKGMYYTGLADCVIKTVRAEGFFALYKGYAAHYLRLGPHTILVFVFWEQYKILFEKLAART
eukprot:Phypoly_transcript_13054.p1 GENE.Phypoly_transcript_13054~~Phypoly_transcript_13054.p1  ORF type:complete len:343 (+),score=21.81 Phypoly_transcript_13054:70-1029(+)